MKEIVSRTNDYIKMLKALKYKKFRDEQGKYLIEGAKTVIEAIEHREKVEAVLVSERENETAAFAEARGVPVIAVPYDIIQQIADTKSPPREIACVIKKQPVKKTDGTFYAALDDVNDPKNLGTIIRTADAVGADGVLISENSADYFGPKAQRAAMGSAFHLDVEVCELPGRIEEFRRGGGVVVAGDLRGEEKLPEAFTKVCLVIGNEARGISESVRKSADILYRLPIYGQAESLNASVAAGIMLYEIRKRLKG